jgi:hypothetical protein
MSNKKQNSLEWYIEETFKLSVKFERQEISQEEYTLGYSNLLQQAKAMHKEEITDAYRISPNNEIWSNSGIDYYNETFGGNNE